MKNYHRQEIIGIAIIVLCIAATVVSTVFATSQYCEAKTREQYPCTEIQQAYGDVIYRVWIDNPSYVEDVLNETDEWCKLWDITNGNIFECNFKCSEDSVTYANNITQWRYIPDSTYRRLRQVFPDLPAEQSAPDSDPPVVQTIDIYYDKVCGNQDNL